MGFLGKLTSAVVKTAITPIAVVKDVVDVSIGGDANNTKNLLESAGEDFLDSTDDLCEGNIVGE